MPVVKSCKTCKASKEVSKSLKLEDNVSTLEAAVSIISIKSSKLPVKFILLVSNSAISSSDKVLPLFILASTKFVKNSIASEGVTPSCKEANIIFFIDSKVSESIPVDILPMVLAMYANSDEEAPAFLNPINNSSAAVSSCPSGIKYFPYSST